MTHLNMPGYSNGASYKFWRPLLVGALVLASACGRDRRWSEEEGEVEPTWRPTPTAVRGLPPDALRAAVTARLGESRPRGIRDHQWQHVRELYATYDGLPLWLEESGPRERARALVSELAKAPTHGLSLGDYPLTELRDALAAVKDSSADAARLAEADVLLSAAYVALAEDLLVGEVEPRSVSQSWYIDPAKVDVDSALAQRLQLEPLDRAIAQLRPEDESYDLLREQLERYRGIVAAGGWATVPEGPSLKPRDTTTVERVTALANRLRVENYVPEDFTPVLVADSGTVRRAVYDETLAGAVASFQAHHAIVVDSILGGQTLASLNTSATYRTGQIAANLERFRWLPRSLGERYILVNVPAFRLTAVDSGRKALEMRVVVGAEYNDRATPVFADSMSTVVFRPYWNVTKKVALEELLPKQFADPTYLARNGYEVVRGWGDNAPVVSTSELSAQAIASERLRIRQKPGGENALGHAKFLFPNDFAIYLHDTPQRDLFERDVRAFSHGCIRVQNPEALAQLVLGWDAARVRAAIESGADNRSVALPKKLPVYIVYLTTYVQEEELYFGNDLYARDQSLVDRVKGGALPDERTTKLLSELTSLVM